MGDFNGDGRADILWRNDNGAMFDFLGTASGGFISNGDNSYVSIDASSRIAGIGDFNGDGRTDVLVRTNSGAIVDWLGTTNGGFIDNGDFSWTTAPAAWNVAGIGDFNGDGRDDILWRNDDGTITDWLGQANGGFADNSPVASQPLSLDLQIAGVGDFNGDGFSDVLLRGTDGTLEAWEGSADGAILSPLEKLWRDALADVSDFVEQIGAIVATASSDEGSGGGGGLTPLSGEYRMMFGPNFPNVYVDGVYGSEFSRASDDGYTLSILFGGVFGSITQLSTAGTFVFQVNGVDLIADWHSGSPPPDDPNEIVVTGQRDAPTGNFQINPILNGFDFGDGYGGGGGLSVATTSPLNTALAHSAMITVGHHNIYLPPLASLTSDEKAAALAFISAVQAIDASIGFISSGAQLTVTETWMDSSGESHSLTLSETASDLAAHWADTSFGLFTGTDYSNLNGPGTNGTGRGSSNMGWDPNMPGNVVAGFNMDGPEGLLVYFQQYGVAALDYLALHEVAHDTVAGFIMNSATANRTDTFISGTPNWANENLANTIAVVTMGALGLSLGDLSPTAGWQTTSHWSVNP